jgi:transforming growth factor-beta-induced protein
MKKQLSKLFTGAFAALFLFAACEDSGSSGTTDPVIEGEQTIAEITELNEAYTTLNSALESTGLLSTFEGSGPFTIFAPTDAAFNALPEGTLESLTADQLADILRYHVVDGAIASNQLNATQDVTTLLGQNVLVEAGSNVVVNSSATVIAADFNASNGIIHAIDQVLLPAGIRDANIVDQAASLGSFTTLLSAATDAGLASTLSYKGDFTVFAPTDDAFAALPEGLLASLTIEQLTEILLYHVADGETFAAAIGAETTLETLEGGSIYLSASESGVSINNNSNVATADVDVSNGVIHAIDTVLLPDAYGTVIDAAAKRFIFSTLVQFVIDAQLATTLSDPNATYTVFAPTNEAFAKLPAEVVNSLTTQDLVNILTYHVLDTQVLAGDLAPTQDVETLNGEDIFIEVGDNALINGFANIIATDFVTNNGVIHVIDEVLLSSDYRDANIIDQAEELGIFTTLVGAVESTGLTSTLKYTGDYTVFAPTDEAFGDLPDGLLASLTDEQLAEILTYHVISGEIFAADLDSVQAPAALSGETLYVTRDGSDVTVNGSSSVVTADVDVSNGVIHAIDEVLLPNEFLNIVQIASKNYDLSTLVSLVADRGLVPTLEGDGPFTLFAPINSGFAAVSDVLDTLTPEQVSEVLTYHVVTSKALSTDLSDGQTITTFQGEDITVAIDGNGNVTFNGATSVVSVDIEGTNGVIHLIDGVLLPPSYTAED